MIKAISTLILACLLWVAAKIVSPIYRCSSFVLRAIYNLNSKFCGVTHEA